MTFYTYLDSINGRFGWNSRNIEIAIHHIFTGCLSIGVSIIRGITIAR
jgi:hypothetical protein